MSDENLLSRRQSLFGIGAAGTALGGAALGVSNAFAGDEKSKEDEKTTDGKDDEKGSDDHDETKKSGLDLEVVCHEQSKAKFRVHNKRDTKVTVKWKLDGDEFDFDDFDGDLDDLTDANGIEDIVDDNGFDDIDDFDDLDLDDFDGDLDDLTDANGIEDIGDDNGFDDIDFDDLDLDDFDLEGKTVKYDGRKYHLEDLVDKKKKEIDLGDKTVDLEMLQGKLTVKKGDSETFWAAAISKATTVDLYHDGKKVDSTAVDKAKCEKATMADKIDLEAVCYRTRKADFADLDETELDNTYDSDVSDVDEDFDPDGEMIVDGEEVDEDDYDGVPDSEGDVIGDSDLESGDLEGLEGHAKIREAKFRVYNHDKKKRKVGWHADGGQGGKLDVDGNDNATFWVTLQNDKKTSATVTYDGKDVDTEKVDTDTECTDSHCDK